MLVSLLWDFRSIIIPNINKSGRALGNAGGKGRHLHLILGQDEPLSQSLRPEPPWPDRRARVHPGAHTRVSQPCGVSDAADEPESVVMGSGCASLFLSAFQQSAFWKRQPISMVLRGLRKERIALTWQYSVS